MSSTNDELLAKLAIAISDSIVDNAVGGWDYSLFIANSAPQWGGTLHFADGSSENLSLDCWSPEVEPLLKLIFSNLSLSTVALKFNITGNVSFIPNPELTEDAFLNDA